MRSSNILYASQTKTKTVLNMIAIFIIIKRSTFTVLFTRKWGGTMAEHIDTRWRESSTRRQETDTRLACGFLKKNSVLYFIQLFCIWMHLSWHVWGQRTTCGSPLFPFTMWVLGLNSRLQVGGIFTAESFCQSRLACFYGDVVPAVESLQ